jgi:hypothetical protein
MTRQLEEERMLLREERAAFEQARTRRSNVGSLEDDIDTAKAKEDEMVKRLEAKYNEAFQKMHALFHDQLDEAQRNLMRQDADKLKKVEFEKSQLELMLLNTGKKIDQLEDALRNQNAPKPVTERKVSDADMWPIYRAMMESFKSELIHYYYRYTKM